MCQQSVGVSRGRFCHQRGSILLYLRPAIQLSFHIYIILYILWLLGCCAPTTFCLGFGKIQTSICQNYKIDDLSCFVSSSLYIAYSIRTFCVVLCFFLCKNFTTLNLTAQEFFYIEGLTTLNLECVIFKHLILQIWNDNHI